MRRFGRGRRLSRKPMHLKIASASASACLSNRTLQCSKGTARNPESSTNCSSEDILGIPFFIAIWQALTLRGRAGESTGGGPGGNPERPKDYRRLLGREYALVELNRLDEAKATLQKAISNGLDVPTVHWQLLDYRLRPRRFADPATGNAVAHESSGGGNWFPGAGGERGRARTFEASQGTISQGLGLGAPASVRGQSAGNSHESCNYRCAVWSVRAPELPHGAYRSCAVRSRRLRKSSSSNSPPTTLWLSRDPGPCPRVGAACRGQSLGRGKPVLLMVDRKATNWGPEYAAAQVGLARAAKLMGDSARAKKDL